MWALLILIEAGPAAAGPPLPAPMAAERQQVVDAIRNCPKGAPGEIIVCSRDRGVAEGYRLPKLDPRYAGAGLKPNGRTLDGAAVAATGAQSCSTVGASGSTGCTRGAAQDWGAWKKRAKDEGQAFPW